MAFLRFPPPPTLRISTRLPGAIDFCGCDEDQKTQFWTGRIIRIQHKRKTICEACIEYADEQAEAARLARQPRKAKPGRFRHINPHRIGA
ncbi:hypothetical protein [Bosea rubneri]|uniref:Uncharacterized protein n=1 Tax=Bosea rubneri TaxID=3075434 RepID=A0ABU3SEF4_9HYPH|nr:hypothetical protein [Bosea sp. ZW T0_25]MDU0343175.1 hypothetical protein [Bosea sp. ZW T0_25]